MSVQEKTETEEKLNSLKDWIKWLAGVAVSISAIFYTLGYFSHVSHYNLLFGVRFSQGTQEYIKFAGDAIIAILLNLITLFTNVKILVNVFSALFTEKSLLVAFFFIIITLTLISLNKFISKASTIFVICSVVSILAAYIALLHFEVEISKLKGVLQPVKPDVVTEILQSKADSLKSLKTRILLLNRLLDKPVNLLENRSVRWEQWFRPDLEEKQTVNRWCVFTISYILIGLVLLTVYKVYKIAIAKCLRHSIVLYVSKIILIFIIVSQLLLFSVLYGTIGCSYNYAVVSLGLDEPGTSKSHPVYLITENEHEIVVYDRLNFFQIRHIPKERILSINQLFYASPFMNCSYGTNEFIPCESHGSLTDNVEDL